MNNSLSELREQVNFVPIGDSLTMGHGAGKGQSWPDQLTKQFQGLNVNFNLLLNPSRSGFTSQQVLDQQVPIFEASEANFSSLLIGANDMAKGVELQTFKQNFVQILDRVQNKLPQSDQVFLLNIPDFAATPAAQKYHGHLHLAEYLEAFNFFIEEQAQARKLELVDLYMLTRKLGPDASLYNWDGLHPSAKGYTEWEKAIRPIAINLLNKRKSPAN